MNTQIDQLEGPNEARTYLMTLRMKVQISARAVAMSITMRTDAEADRFEQAVIDCGGEIVKRSKLGRGRGYRFDFVMPIAWDAYFGGNHAHS